MLQLKTDVLELRGLRNNTSKKGNVYYTLHCESVDGEPYQFYCQNPNAFPQGLKKGDSIQVLVSYNRFKELVVESVLKVCEE